MDASVFVQLHSIPLRQSVEGGHDATICGLQTRPRCGSAIPIGDQAPPVLGDTELAAHDNVTPHPLRVVRVWRRRRCVIDYTAGMGALYVIGTPIGNLEDITVRAARILASVPLVAAEDTRVTRRLLTHLDVRPRLLSCNEHNWRRRLPALLEALDSGDVALVTDAGAPGISDPGVGVVAAVADAGYHVVSVPGVSAVSAALSVAGFPADRFAFLGFLPRRRSERTATLGDAAGLGQTLVIFEAPHRLRATLTDIADALNDPPLAVCRELTKLHEEVWRGTASDAVDYFTEPRGEFTIVVGPMSPEDAAPDGEPVITVAAARAALAQRRAAGMRGREAVAEVVAATGLSRRTVYALWVETGSQV